MEAKSAVVGEGIIAVVLVNFGLYVFMEGLLLSRTIARAFAWLAQTLLFWPA